ncbi:MAG: peptide deformylase [Actinomycetota bacterium]
MAVRQVLRYPHATLKAPARPVVDVGDASRRLAEDLVDSMRAGPATVGLAAPQIGVPLRAFVIDVSSHPKAVSSHGLVVLFDPEVLGSAGGEVAREGCLSVPDLTADVRRASRMAVRGMDEHGTERTFDFAGFEARAAAHELDHLDGILILDRVDAASSLFPRRVYR